MKPSDREAQQGCGRNRWAKPECVRAKLEVELIVLLSTEGEAYRAQRYAEWDSAERTGRTAAGHPDRWDEVVNKNWYPAGNRFRR